MTRLELERLAPVVLGILEAAAVLACVCLVSLILRGTWHPWRRLPQPEPEPEPTWINASGIEYLERDGLMVRADGGSSEAGAGWPAGIIQDIEETEKDAQKSAENVDDNADMVGRPNSGQY